MLKFKNIFVMLFIAMIMSIAMPSDWHYRKLGKVTKNTPHAYYGVNSKKLQRTEYEIDYTEQGSNEPKRIMLDDSGLWDGRALKHMNKDRNMYAYEYRGWTEPMIWIVIYLLLAIFIYCAMEPCPTDCNYCPLYYLCHNERKKKDEKGLCAEFTKWLTNWFERQNKKHELTKYKSNNIY